MTTRRFPAVHVMHCIAVKFLPVFHRMFAACGETSAVAVSIVETMIDMSIEMVGSVIPGACADEDTAGEPFWAVVAVGSAVIGRNLVVAVRANGRFSDADCNLCRSLRGRSQQETCRNRHKAEIFNCFHIFAFHA